MIPYAGVSFLTYETLKDLCLYNPYLTPYTLNPNHEQNTDRLKLRVWAFLGSGALSGALAQTASYPFEIIRRNMQVAGLTDYHSKDLTSTAKTFKHIYSQKGPRGFFVGLSIGYLKVTPMFAISFLTYEWMRNLMGI